MPLLRPATAIALALGVFAANGELSAANLGHEARIARLRDAPITLYPDFDLKGTKFPAFVNERARPRDAVVVSWRDAFKPSFRVASLGLREADVWIYIAGPADLVHEHWRNIAGARGVVFIPGRSIFDLMRAVRRVAEDADVAKLELRVGLEAPWSNSAANVTEIAPFAKTFTIYDNTRLRGGVAAYHKYVEWLAAEARHANPKVEIEIGISTGRDLEATRYLARVLWECAPLLDRIAIYCEDSPESYASLALLFQVLRSGAPAAPTNRPAIK